MFNTWLMTTQYPEITIPFNPVPSGSYSIACDNGSSNATYPVCMRINNLTGFRDLLIATNWQLTAWRTP